MNFIKKIFQNNPDEEVHRQFTRFGKGEYGRRALLGLWKTPNKIKIKSSFEFANDFVRFVSGLGNIKFNGDIWSKEELQGVKGIKKQGKYISSVKDFSSEQIEKIYDKASWLLLNSDGSEIKLKIKSKLPKPGKGEDKIDDKFCQLELDPKYYPKAKEDFFWDLTECKKANVEHSFIITDIVLPKTAEKDYAKLREMAKRKGKIIRTVNRDGEETKKGVNFEA